MDKIFRYLLCFVFFASSSLASEFGDEETNQFQSTLASILGEKVKVDVDSRAGTVQLLGTKSNVEEAISALRNFKTLRGSLLPVNHSVSQTQASNDPIDSWTHFIQASGVDLVEFNMFNITSDRILDSEGVVTFKTESSCDKGLVGVYIEALKERSQFFKWACQNLHGFLGGNDTKTIINYALLSEFLYLQPKSPLVFDEVSEEATVVFSAQNILKNLIAAVCGDVALVSDDAENYRVKTLSLGAQSSHTKSTLEILVDKSGSMSGTPIDRINRALPDFFQALQGSLPMGSSVTVVLKAFDDQLEGIGQYEVKKEGYLPDFPPIVTGGFTDLTLIGNSLGTGVDERKKVIAFTDGEHVSDSNLNNSLDKMRALVKSGKRFAQPRLCKVGGNESAYFKDVSTIFGGSYSTESDISTFCQSVISEMSDLMVSRTDLVFNLAGEHVVVKWVRDDVPGIFSTSQKVEQGDSVVSNGITYLVDQVSVEGDESCVSLTPEETRLAKIAALKEELARLESEL